MTIYHYIGIAVTLLVIVGLSIYSGMHKSQGENKNSMPVVAGLIMGTLVGGSSTVGTAQLAYTYGMSAWWFTLGGGIACLILALGYVKPMRKAGSPTLIGMISKEYGSASGMTASIFSSVGMFINIISQLIAATAVIAVVLPNLGMVPALVFSAVFMALYVVFGGTKGAGMVGIVKLVLLYISMIGSGVIVLSLTGGVGGFTSLVSGIDNPDGISFFSVFARGIGKDLGALLSLIFGVLTTQTYAQAVLTAKSDRAAMQGALISAIMIPPIGIGGILVGLYMRANYPDIVPKTALTLFVTEHMPSLLGGVVLGTLFIAVVGTGAGLALGISSIVKNDIVGKLAKPDSKWRNSGALQNLVIVIVLAAACAMSAGSFGDMILNFAFMSMGLRGAVVFAPLTGALYMPGKIQPKFALAAIIVGPILVLIFNLLFDLSFDPLIIAIACAMGILLCGYRKGQPTDR